jgi:hypothetical protein
MPAATFAGYLVTTLISVGLTVASIAYQVIQAKKMKKAAADAAEARKGFEVVTSGDVQTIPIVYGRAKVGGTRVWHNTKSDHTVPEDYVSNADKVFDIGPPGQAAGSLLYYDEDGNPITRVIPAVPAGLMNGPLSGSKNEFLYFQQVLCHGPINRVVDFVIDESRFSDDPALGKYSGGDGTKGGFISRALRNVTAAFRSEITYNSTSTNSMIVHNFPDRAEAKFPGLVVASTAIRLNRDDPQFSSNVPMVQYFIEGRKVRTITNGALSSTRVYTNNPAWCLLDYLLATSDRTFNGVPLFDTGRALSVDDIDLASFEAAAAICSTIVASNKPVYGNVWQATDKSVNTTVRSVPLYECNIIIDVSKPIRENVESILSCMGDARLVWSAGKYKLSLQYPSTNADIVTAAVITDNDLVTGSDIQLNWPSAGERLNHAIVRFANEAENFKEDTASWPPKSNGTFSRGIRGSRYPVSNSSAGNILGSYGVWSGNSANTTLEWRYKAVANGTHDFKLQIDDSGVIFVYNQAGTLLTTQGASGWKNVTAWQANLVAGDVYRIVITGNDTGGERGVAATISKNNFLYWTTRDPAYAAYDIVSTSSNIYDVMRAEDNGVELETSIFLEGCTDYYHALAKAEELVRTSRTAIGVSFQYIVKDNFLEPGDIIKLESSTLNLGESDFYVRVNQVKLQEGATCEIIGSRFDYTQLAWNVADDQYVVPPNVYGFGIPAPKDVVYTPAQANVPNSAGTLTWAGEKFDSFSTYVIYVNTYNDFDADGRVLFREIGRTTSQAFNLPHTVASSAYFGVRAMSKANRFSDMVLSSELAISLLDLYTAKAVNLSANTSVAFVKPRNGTAYLPATLGFTIAPEGFTAPQIRWFIDDVLQATYSNQTTAAIPAFSDKASKFLKVRVFEGASDIFAEDVITLFSLQEGSDAYQLALSNENIELTAFADGTYKNSAQFPIAVTSIIQRGATTLTAGSYSITTTGLTATVNASGVISITAVSQPFANLTLTAVIDGQTLSKLLRVITVKDGQVGASVTEVSAYKRSAEAPTTPTGGSYNFETNALTPPSGWSIAIPTGSDPVYLSKATAQGLTVDELLTWSAPVLAFQNGEKGDKGDAALPVALDISGLANFTRNAGGAYTPATKALTAVVTNLTGPSYAWEASGATLSSTSGITTTMTPDGSTDTITVTLTVTSASLSFPLALTRSVTVAYNGAPGAAGQNGIMSSFPTIYRWTTNSTPPTRPATSSSYTWSDGTFTAPTNWTAIPPSNTTQGSYLWSITVPLTVVATTATSTLDWTDTAFAIRAVAYNGVDGTPGAPGTDGDPGADGTPGSATYLINRGNVNTDAQPTNAEVVAAVGRSAQVGDIATINYNSGNASVAYRATGSGVSATWSLQASYITGSLIVENTITGNKVVAKSLNVDQIDTKNLDIRDANDNVLFSSGGLAMQGLSGNLLRNSGFEDGIAGCRTGYWNTPSTPTIGWNLGPAYNLSGQGLAFIYSPGTSTIDTVFDFRVNQLAVAPNTRYEASALVNAHRCSAAIHLVWLDSSGAYISEVIGDGITYQSSVYTLSDLRFTGVFATSPAGAAYCQVQIRSAVKAADPYAFIKNVYFGMASQGQTTNTPWSPGQGLNQISAANASTYIADAAIGSAQIGSLSLTGVGKFNVKTAVSGARMEMDSRAIKVFDVNGTLRVQIGDLTA